MDDRPHQYESEFEAAKRARYERLSLLTLDMAEAAGNCARGVDGEITPRKVDRAMRSVSRAIWAHQVIERLRQGKPLSRRELMRLALGEHSFYRNETTDTISTREPRSPLSQDGAYGGYATPSRPTNLESELEPLYEPQFESEFEPLHEAAFKEKCDAPTKALTNVITTPNIHSDTLLNKASRFTRSFDGAYGLEHRAKKRVPVFQHPGATIKDTSPSIALRLMPDTLAPP